MAHTTKAFLVFIISIILSTVYGQSYAQIGFVSGGNTIVVSDGSEISCSIGQIAYQYEQSVDGSVQEGLQQTEVKNAILKIQSEESSNVSVVPNPAKDYCIVHLASMGKYQYTFVSMEGKIVSSGVLQDGSVLSLTNFVDGVYILHIVLNEIDFLTYRIVKE